MEVEEVEMEEKSNVEEYISPEQISSPLVTLSMLPESRWQTLINLELIKVYIVCVFLNNQLCVLYFITSFYC